EALLQDLAGFEADEAAELFLVGAQLLAEQPHQFAAPRRRHLAPGSEGFYRVRDLAVDRTGVVERHPPDLRSIHGRVDNVIASARLDAQIPQYLVGLHLKSSTS